MANVHKILIEGKLPYDIVHNSKLIKHWFANFSSPCWGFRIEYSGKTSCKKLDNGGEYWYYDFKISGEEAVWGLRIEDFVKELVKYKVEIKTAKMCDIEEYQDKDMYDILD